ncbi:hypothetical protein DEO72_LG4g50 [Vigna unguiculata]|uniref:Uncharacterized protein n=1 Tax=Vigna unguiculata TaxID=3917 RepID=A0A4D6LK69_VIGUN|nr:hypothetical protein DEO72_LG4g50 [Vigna unguiculata]
MASNCPQMSTMEVLVHKSFELVGFCTSPSWSVHRLFPIQICGVLCKNEIRGFRDVRVGMASNCPQMSTMEVLVHKSFELVGFCTSPSWSVHRLFPIQICGVLCKNEIRGFRDVRVGMASNCPQMSTMEVLVHKSFELVGFCTSPSWSVHRLFPIQICGVLCKNEIRGFRDVRVGKAYKCPKMNTMKVLEHESFELVGFCKWPRLSVHHDIGRWLGGEFCEKMKFMVFEM